MTSVTSHAIIIPWPLSQGIRTWCGFDCQDDALKGDLVAMAPDKVDCEACIHSMRQALKNLDEWVPDLHVPVDNETGLIAGQPAKVVHLLHEGLPVCGFTRDVPKDWPIGHEWAGLATYRNGKTDHEVIPLLCDECVKVAGPPEPTTDTMSGESIEELAARGANLEEYPCVGWCGCPIDNKSPAQVCGIPQYQTVGRATCRHGHGGAPTLDKDPHA